MAVAALVGNCNSSDSKTVRLDATAHPNRQTQIPKFLVSSELKISLLVQGNLYIACSVVTFFASEDTSGRLPHAFFALARHKSQEHA